MGESRHVYGLSGVEGALMSTSCLQAKFLRTFAVQRAFLGKRSAKANLSWSNIGFCPWSVSSNTATGIRHMGLPHARCMKYCLFSTLYT